MNLQIIAIIVIGLMALAWVVRRFKRFICSSRTDYCQGCDDECCPYRRQPYKEK